MPIQAASHNRRNVTMNKRSGRFRMNTSLFRPPLELMQDDDDNEAGFFSVSGYATTGSVGRSD
jgi:hypothetical protein